jgi:translation elongation factor EF-Tu-like GTPase
MASLLFVVEDTFSIKGRGTVLVPGFSDRLNLKIGKPIEFRRPDGSRLTSAIQGIEMLSPNPTHTVPILVSVVKDEIPIKSEVWTID